MVVEDRRGHLIITKCLRGGGGCTVKIQNRE